MISHKHITGILIASLLSSPAFASQPDKDCVDWFNHGKIAPGSKDCDLKCTSLITGMGTFMCPDQCDLLCKKKEEPSLLGKFIYYPGLTQAEKKLLAVSPNDAVTVYKQKRIAEESSTRNFPNQDM